MLLAIDAGNTNVTFALFQGDTKIAAWRSATDAAKTADDWAAWLLPLWQVVGLDVSAIHGAILASVVPAMDMALLGLCKKYFKLNPLFVGDEKVKTGLTIKLPNPEQLGADRIVNAVAVKHCYAPPAIVVDFGTATTFDVLARNGDYVGGVIAPGPRLSLQALSMAAAKLPSIPLQKPKRVTGTDTVSAMQSGVFYGYVAMVEGLVNRLQTEHKNSMMVIATGGLAEQFAKATPIIQHFDADLTLKGLRLIYEMNTQ